MKKIEMTPITSSQIKSVGYDETYSALYIEFINGTVYRYTNVPIEHFNMLKVPTVSAGKYFGASIRNIFRYEKLLTITVIDGHIEL